MFDFIKTFAFSTTTGLARVVSTLQEILHLEKNPNDYNTLTLTLP